MDVSEPVMPRGTKVPMKVNAFEFARQANAQLLPLFPYVDRGDMVPCSASFLTDGTPGVVGYFLHTNSVDEVAVLWGSDGRNRTGDVFVGPRTHGVGGDPESPFYAVMVITQRQREDGVQPEAIIFQCTSCSSEVYRHDFDQSIGAGGAFRALATIIGSNEAAVGFNASDQNRTCPSCGHVNASFPLQMWGWGQFVRNTMIAEKGWASLGEVA